MNSKVWSQTNINLAILMIFLFGTAFSENTLNTQYDYCAKEYADIVQDENKDSISDYIQQFNFSLKNKYVLDLGCGDGYDLSWMGEQGAVLFGIDSSKEMVLLAKEKNPEAEIVHALFEKIPFKTAFFDFVISKWALQTTAELDKVYEEAARVLKPGGQFIYLTSHPIRQFLEKKKNGKNYFLQEIVESTFFDGKITALEPSHTMSDYLSPTFFRYFSLESFKEGIDAGAEKVNSDIYPSYFIIIAKKNSEVKK